MIMYVGIKRGREREKFESLKTMANCLILLSRAGGSETPRVFECKTCNRQFPSFQALGGHRASHKKPRLTELGEVNEDTKLQLISQPAKPKTHECSICGVEFAIGQALGGHMRRHRAVAAALNEQNPRVSTPKLSLSIDDDSESIPPPAVSVPVVKRSNSTRRVICLDLNLTPSENGLDFAVLDHKAVAPPPPMLHCYF